MTSKFVLFAYTLGEPDGLSRYRVFGIFGTREAALDYLDDYLNTQDMDPDSIDLVLDDIIHNGNSRVGEHEVQETIYVLAPTMDYSSVPLGPFGQPSGSGRSRQFR